MELPILIVLQLCFFNCLGMNSSDEYLRFANPFGGKRKDARLINFHADSGEISVELDFSVPFISLPIKDSMQMGKNLIANINVGSILLSGAVIFATSFLLPALIGLFTKKIHPHPTGQYKSDNSHAWQYLTMVDDILLENNIDSTSCIQRLTCWSVKNASKKVNKGKGSSYDKILDGIASNPFLTEYIDGTAIKEAITNGYSNINCSKEYNKCYITQETIRSLTQNFLKALNGIA